MILTKVGDIYISIKKIFSKNFLQFIRKFFACFFCAGGIGVQSVMSGNAPTLSFYYVAVFYVLHNLGDNACLCLCKGNHIHNRHVGVRLAKLF